MHLILDKMCALVRRIWMGFGSIYELSDPVEVLMFFSGKSIGLLK